MITLFLILSIAETAWLAVISRKLTKIERKLKNMAHTIDEVLTGVQEESTVDDSIITLLQNIKKQLDDLLAGNLPPETQAKVDAIFDQVQANKTKVADAVTANTPPQTP